MMPSTAGGNLARSTGRCAGSDTPPSDDAALWYMEYSPAKGELDAPVTEKALDGSVSAPPPVLLQPSDERPGGEPAFHGWKPLTRPGAPSHRAGELDGPGSPIRLQVAASRASGVLPSRGSS